MDGVPSNHGMEKQVDGRAHEVTWISIDQPLQPVVVLEIGCIDMMGRSPYGWTNALCT